MVDSRARVYFLYFNIDEPGYVFQYIEQAADREGETENAFQKGKWHSKVPGRRLRRKAQK